MYFNQRENEMFSSAVYLGLMGTYIVFIVSQIVWKDMPVITYLEITIFDREKWNVWMNKVDYI